MKYRTITKSATLVSVALWACAASLWVNHSTASFGIVGILAALFQVIAINSARREGQTEGRRTWFVDRILDEVSDETK